MQVTALLPDGLSAELDVAAGQLKRSRADVIRQAIEYYLDDFEDLRCGIEASRTLPTPFWIGLRCSMRCSLQIKRSAARALAALQKSDRERLVQPSKESSKG